MEEDQNESCSMGDAPKSCCSDNDSNSCCSDKESDSCCSDKKCKPCCKVFYFILTVVITAVVVGGGVYYWQSSKAPVKSPTPTTKTPVVKTDVVKENTTTTKTLTFKDKIEDFSSYKKSTFNDFLTKDCKGYADIDKKLTSGEVKEKVLYESKTNPFTVYITQNYEKWTTDQFKKVNTCMEGAGQVGALKAFSNYLLWGRLNCGGVSVPGDNQAGCVKTASDLEQYLGEKDVSTSKSANKTFTDKGFTFTYPSKYTADEKGLWTQEGYKLHKETEICSTCHIPLYGVKSKSTTDTLDKYIIADQDLGDAKTLDEALKNTELSYKKVKIGNHEFIHMKGDGMLDNIGYYIKNKDTVVAFKVYFEKNDNEDLKNIIKTLKFE